MADETNEKSRGFEDVMDEEDDVHEVEKIQGRKSQQQKYLKQISNDDENPQQEEISDVEKKMKTLLLKAEQYASFLVSRHQQKKNKKQVVQKRRGQYQEEKEEEEQLIKEEEEEDDNLPTILTSQPKILKGGKLKDYQMIGLNWMISLYETGLNGILADDMGLGKTIQSISLIGFLKEFKKINGPHLIIAPKSTLGNWFNEFQKWLPCCRTIKLIATKDEREEILQNYIANSKFDVCLTSFEGAKLCQKYLKKINFQYIIIDEAHKIKNEESQTALILRMFKTNYKILLTGTPLQNNLHELWSLLNFLLPDLFSSSEIFDEWFSANNLSGKNNNEENDTKNIEMISQLHRILKPFMMRRTKSEVMQTLPPKKEIHLYVGLTESQLNIYRNLLSPKKSITGSEDDKKFYLNILMQLRKVCNHPYLFEGIEEEGLPPLGEHIITNCGKMMVLDKLLQKLKNGKHQVLIFSQMTMVLDILEDYCNYRQFKYCRIDGNTDMTDRDNQISDFVKEDSTKYIFLLSTRAGGLGINLATADTVVLYDSDWNPQMDLQAMDRAHRIGQKNIVNVYRLISENTIEEKIIERQTIKLKWDQLIIQQGRLAQKNRVLSRDEIKDMIQFGASAIFKSKGGTYTDEDIDILLQRGEQKTKDHNKTIDEKFKKSNEQVGELSLSSINIYDFLQKNHDNDKTKEDKEALDEQLARELASELRSRREKKTMNYNINAQFSHMMATAPMPKAAKIIKLPEHQLFVEREKLQELLQKEEDFKCMSNRAKKAEKEEENSIEENGLTPKENKLKDQYWATGFPTWLKQEYLSFIQGCERFGKTAYKEIAEHIKTKTEEEVSQYSKAFWERIDTISEKDKIIKNIERGEQILKQKLVMSDLLKERCKIYQNVKEEFEFNSAIYNKSKSKFYTTENDKFLIYASYQMGYCNWPVIIKEIKTNPMFQFDHFFKSRSEYELNKRLQSLLKVVEKEKDFIVQIEAKKLKLKQEQEEKQREQELKKEQQKQQQQLLEQQKAEKEKANQQQQQQQQQQQLNTEIIVTDSQPKPQQNSNNNKDSKNINSAKNSQESQAKQQSTIQKSSNQQSNQVQQTQKIKDPQNSSSSKNNNTNSKTNGLKQNSLLNYGVKVDKKVQQAPILIDLESEDEEDDKIKIKRLPNVIVPEPLSQESKQETQQKQSQQSSQSSNKQSTSNASNNINSKKSHNVKDDKIEQNPQKKLKRD
ncbi:SNF2 family amine-terminal protein (macronuclear) [Tetrahymena thermophila SB210]|uniref:SNF2 family amine-terminal protein n=1 Tax=Tetrahymena thermophila (strain SB210) TaxID=312017 RepID=I7M280_TETTS|nr:SNF2 family amine-terminal protein [Tetrahymena thermophila SB210]EAR99498.2 SNF2 family amine-terminal protein [Tetrahymena thermophila SB210]|eukprot:XP_001019743.2 SNF2 family amine-terminal protein [Tetrahymena thermophila SB210]